MSRIRIYAEASLPIVVVLLLVGSPASLVGALMVVTRYPDLWVVPLAGYLVTNACSYLFLYMVLSNDGSSGLDIALIISIFSLPYSALTATFLSIVAEPINYPLMTAGIAAPVIGFAVVLGVIFRMQVRQLTEIYSSSAAVDDRTGRE